MISRRLKIVHILMLSFVILNSSVLDKYLYWNELSSTNCLIPANYLQSDSEEVSNIARDFCAWLMYQ